MQDYFAPQEQKPVSEIDERIDVHDFFSQREEQRPLQSPDLLKYVYMTQLLRARNSPGSNGFFEDWMFKEQVASAHQQQQKDNSI